MKHTIVAHSALGADTLRFRAMEGTEALSQLFEFDVELVADSSALDLKALLGQPLTLEIETADGALRHLDGIVARAMLLGRDGHAGTGAAREYRYRAIVRPWLWLLTQSRDCKIFQHRTVPDIVQAVLADYGFPVAVRLTASYRTWAYCVQYQESDFDFVSRLLQHEGIYYYFEHALGSHTLVLADDMAAHSPLPGAAAIPFFAAERAASANIDCIDAYEVAEEFAPGAYVTDDYNFTTPRASLQNVRTNANAHEHGALEVYEWMGGYGEAGDADHYSRIRLQELQAEKERDIGHAWSRSMAPGYRFTLRNCPRADANREYLLVEVRYRLRDAGYASNGGQPSAASHECDFVTQPATLPYRPRRTTPKPHTGGPQTAVVVGPPGETVWTDEYGRIKVQFRWDRYGNHDENSSCWLRVVSSAAGSGMGAVNIPRIGQEVLVDFIGGEPDRPIVMGATYNAEMMTAFGLPANASRSGFVSRTFKGGPSQANSLYFEDKPGAEELALHAEKDYEATVEHDKTNEVGKNHDETIHGHSRQAVDGNKHTTVDRRYTHAVRGTSKRHVAGSSRQTHASSFLHTTVGPSTIERRAAHSQHYAASYSHHVAGLAHSTYLAPHVQRHEQTLVHSVAADHLHRVEGNHTHEVDGDHAVIVGGDDLHTVEGNLSHTVSADHVHTVSGDHVLTVMGDSDQTTTGSHTTVAKEIHIGGSGGGGMANTKPAASHGSAAQISIETIKLTGAYITSLDFSMLRIAGTVGNIGLDILKAATTVQNFVWLGADMKVARLKSEAVALEVKAAKEIQENGKAWLKFLFLSVKKSNNDNLELVAAGDDGGPAPPPVPPVPAVTSAADAARLASEAARDARLAAEAARDARAAAEVAREARLAEEAAAEARAAAEAAAKARQAEAAERAAQAEQAAEKARKAEQAAEQARKEAEAAQRASKAEAEAAERARKVEEAAAREREAAAKAEQQRERAAAEAERLRKAEEEAERARKAKEIEEQARKAKEAEEQARKAEEAAEQARKAEEAAKRARDAETAAERAKEAEAAAERARKAEEAAKEARQAEKAAEEARDAQKVAEREREAAVKAEQERQKAADAAARTREAEAAAERERQAEAAAAQARKAEEAADQARKAEEAAQQAQKEAAAAAQRTRDAEAAAERARQAQTEAAKGADEARAAAEQAQRAEAEAAARLRESEAAAERARQQAEAAQQAQRNAEAAAERARQEAEAAQQALQTPPAGSPPPVTP